MAILRNRKFVLGILFFLVVFGVLIIVPTKIQASHITPLEACSNYTGGQLETCLSTIEKYESVHVVYQCLTGDFFTAEEAIKFGNPNDYIAENDKPIVCNPIVLGVENAIHEGSGGANPTLSSRAGGIPTSGCGITESFFSPFQCALKWGFEQITAGMLWLSSWLLFVTAIFFRFAIEISLNIGGSDIFEVARFGWAILRDFANIFFIFIILWIAIRTILSIGGSMDKTLLTRLVIVALLVNFSFFFTAVIIDVSNTITVSIYNEILQDAKTKVDAEIKDGGGAVVNSFLTADSGLSALIMDKVRLTTLFQVVETEEGSQLVSSGSVERSSFLINLGGTVFILVLAFVFLAGGILFVIRTLAFLILLILAPLAYVGSIIPQAGGYSNTWWKRLLAEAQFAPIFMLLIFVSIRGLDILGFVGNDKVLETGFAGFFTTKDPSSIAIVFNFIIVIGLLVASLKVAKDLGTSGAGHATKLAADATARVGRGSFGRIGNSIAGSKWAGKLARSETSAAARLAGRTAQGVGHRLRTASFDVRATGLGGAVARQIGAGSAGGRGGFKKETVDAFAKKKRERALRIGERSKEEMKESKEYKDTERAAREAEGNKKDKEEERERKAADLKSEKDKSSVEQDPLKITSLEKDLETIDADIKRLTEVERRASRDLESYFETHKKDAMRDYAASLTRGRFGQFISQSEVRPDTKDMTPAERAVSDPRGVRGWFKTKKTEAEAAILKELGKSKEEKTLQAMLREAAKEEKESNNESKKPSDGGGEGGDNK